MWQKFALAIALKVIASIDWETLLIKVLTKVDTLIKEKTGLEVGLPNYADEILTLVEQELEEHLPISLDLNQDGK